MTVTAFPARDEYTATAGQTVFNYTFKIYASDELNVYVTPSGQEANDSTDLTTAYTVDSATIGNESGGFITLGNPTSAGDLVTIVSGIPYDRTVDYQDSGDFLPDTVNGDNDRQVSQIKQIAEVAGRSLVFQQSLQNADSLSLPNPVAGYYLRWKGDLSGLENTGAPGSVIPSEVNGTASDMVANTSLQVGDFVITVGYSVEGDGGDNTYEIVAGGTGTADGGLYIDLANGLQAKGLFPQAQRNPKQWGAVGDGITDDTSALQNTLNNAENIFITPGEYRISSGLEIRPDTTLTMYGATIKVLGVLARPVLLNATAGGLYPAYTANSNITILGGTWDCDNVADGLTFVHAENIKVKDVSVLNVLSGHAVEVTAIKKMVISGCRFVGFTDGGGRDFSEAIQIEGAYTAGGAPHIDPGSADGSICEDVIVSECITSGWPRFCGDHSYTSAAFSRSVRISVSDSLVYGPWDAAVFANGWNDVSIQGIVGIDCQEYGVVVEDCSNFTVTGCVMRGTGGSVINGIYVNADVATEVFNGTVSGNKVDSFNIGIRSNRINGVAIDGNVATDSTTVGIRIADNKRAAISDNIARNTGTDGLALINSVQGANGVTVTGNLFSGNAVSNGVFVQNENSIIISDNRIENYNDGIQLDNSIGSNISGNSMASIVANGVNITGTSNGNVIIANNIRSSATGVLTALGVDDNIVTNNWLSNSGTPLNLGGAGDISANNKV